MQLPCQQHAAVTWMLLMQGVILLIGIALTGLGWSNPIRDGSFFTIQEVC